MTQPMKRAPHPFADSIGAQLTEAQAKQGLSDNRLAKASDVSRRHLVEIKKGANVTLLMAKRVGQALGLTSLHLGDGFALNLPNTIDVLQALDDVERGAALILDAVGNLRNTVAREHPPADVRSELAKKAAHLLDDFEAHVKSLDTQEQIDTLQRLMRASLATTPDTGQQASPARRRRKG